jgi:L-serine dehydratase
VESISAFDIIKIGIGPSSSHTMGPWIAARKFLDNLTKGNKLMKTTSVKVYLYGSLAKTGKGHGTDLAVLLSLTGEDYKKIDTNTVAQKFNFLKESSAFLLDNIQNISFDFASDIIFEKKISLPFHPNGIKFVAYDHEDIIFEDVYYSVGGGFVVTEQSEVVSNTLAETPFQCNNGADILSYCAQKNITISELIKLNELVWRSEKKIEDDALEIWEEIKDCIWRGAHKGGILPGGLFVKRRAAELNTRLVGELKYSTKNEWLQCIRSSGHNFSAVNKWVSCFALAVNEENAAFGRIVTAPTNGAAGVIPAVLMYAYCFTENFSNKNIIDFLLVAGEIGTLFKKAATISAAMGGCQAEIGVSSAMAAAALTHTQGGTTAQVLMAAEIAMEHHLGMTCDPVGGLVQIPCIERNSMGAIKAITASNIALESDPSSAKVSLDDVIKTMWQTALDMNSKYKETSEGGLATNISVNMAEC